jgi:hypothetical protein
LGPAKMSFLRVVTPVPHSFPRGLLIAMITTQHAYRYRQKIAGPRCTCAQPRSDKLHLGRPVGSDHPALVSRTMSWNLWGRDGEASGCGDPPLQAPVVHVNKIDHQGFHCLFLVTSSNNGRHLASSKHNAAQTAARLQREGGGTMEMA